MERIRVATLNVWGHPDWIGRHGRQRMRAIAGALPDLDLDLVAFQEVWTDAAHRSLVEGGRDAGFEWAWPQLGEEVRGGLLTISRRPIHATRFRRYRLGGLPQRIHHGDYYGGKGFAIATLDTVAGPLALLNTHLQAQYAPDPEDEYRGHRVGQLVEIAAHLAALPGPIVAVGDFNIRERNPEYRVLTGLAGLVDAAARLDSREPTVLADHPYRGAGHGEDERIDYVFLRRGRRVAPRPLVLERIFDERLTFGGEPGAYSDHAGVRAELEIVGAPSGELPAPEPEAVELASRLLERGREEAHGRRRTERWLAGAAVAAAFSAGLAARDRRISRRRLIRAGLSSFALAGLATGAGAGLLSEHFVPAELAAYEELERLLRSSF